MMTTRRTLLGGLALLPALTAVPAFARVRRADAAGDAALEAVFASTAPPALAAGIVGRDGLGWNGVRGIRQAGQSEPATTGERWHLGSNTKAMTAAVFARLVEQGRARWAMPLAVAFPGLTLDPAWSATTLDDVMHHRAGLLDAEVMGRPWLMAARADPAPCLSSARPSSPRRWPSPRAARPAPSPTAMPTMCCWDPRSRRSRVSPGKTSCAPSCSGRWP